MCLIWILSTWIHLTLGCGCNDTMCLRAWCGSSFHLVGNQHQTLLCAMSKEADGKEHVAQKVDLIEHMRETLSSPEFFATLSGVDKVIRDPISLVGLESTSDQKPEVVNGDGGLGHREEDVNRKDAQPFGTQEQGVTQKEALPVGTQGPGIEQKDVLQDALPFGSQEQGAGRDGWGWTPSTWIQCCSTCKETLQIIGHAEHRDG